MWLFLSDLFFSPHQQNETAKGKCPGTPNNSPLPTTMDSILALGHNIWQKQLQMTLHIPTFSLNTNCPSPMQSSLLRARSFFFITVIILLGAHEFHSSPSPEKPSPSPSPMQRFSTEDWSCLFWGPWTFNFLLMEDSAAEINFGQTGWGGYAKLSFTNNWYRPTLWKHIYHTILLHAIAGTLHIPTATQTLLNCEYNTECYLHVLTARSMHQ